jgi:hypothetical protein
MGRIKCDPFLFLAFLKNINNTKIIEVHMGQIRDIASDVKKIDTIESNVTQLQVQQPTAVSQLTNDSGYQTLTQVQTRVDNAITALVDSAPGTLNTLNELAAALGDDPNFATTVVNAIGTKWTQDITKISNWDLAYSWGNHSNSGYALTSTVNDGLATKASLSGATFTGDLFLRSGQVRLGLYNFAQGEARTYHHVKTNIPWQNYTQMYSIEFKGHEYGASLPIDCRAVWYQYAANNTAISFGSNGTHSLAVYSSSDGYVVIRIQFGSGYYAAWTLNQYTTTQGLHQFTVTAVSAQNAATYY